MSPLRRAHVIVHGQCGASGIQGVAPGDGLQHQRHVVHGASKRPDVVERGGERHQTVAGDPAVGSHHSDDVAERRRLPDGPSRVRSQRDGGKIGGNGGGRTAARSAGHAGQIAGIVGGKKAGVFRRRTHGEFVAIRLAEDDGPRALQPFDRGGVVRRDEILQDVRRAGGAGSAGQDDVLDRDGHAGQGRERFAGGNRLVHLLRLRESALRAQAEVGAHFLVLLLDARQMGLGDFDGRGLPALQKFMYLADR